MMFAPFLAITLALAPAQADATAPSQTSEEADAANVERLFAEGATLYRDGKYAAAIERFEEAYAIYEEPNLLYNIGRAYEALGQTQKALETFETCVRHPKVEPQTKSKASARVTALRAAIAASDAVKAPPPSTTPPPQTAPAAPVPAAGTPPAVTAATRDTSEVDEESAAGLPLFLIGGGAVAAVGVVALAAGAVSFAIGAITHGQVESALSSANGGVVQMTQVEAQNLNQQGTEFKTYGVIAAGAGLAVVLVGAAIMPLEFLVGGESE